MARRATFTIRPLPIALLHAMFSASPDSQNRIAAARCNARSTQSDRPASICSKGASVVLAAVQKAAFSIFALCSA
jgi:hypothetical protein